jgi:hypothetical protein
VTGAPRTCAGCGTAAVAYKLDGRFFCEACGRDDTIVNGVSETVRTANTTGWTDTPRIGAEAAPQLRHIATRAGDTSSEQPAHRPPALIVIEDDQAEPARTPAQLGEQVPTDERQPRPDTVDAARFAAWRSRDLAPERSRSARPAKAWRSRVALALGAVVIAAVAFVIVRATGGRSSGQTDRGDMTGPGETSMEFGTERCGGENLPQLLLGLTYRNVAPPAPRTCIYEVGVASVSGETADGWTMANVAGSRLLVAAFRADRPYMNGAFIHDKRAIFLGVEPFEMVNGARQNIATFELTDAPAPTPLPPTVTPPNTATTPNHRANRGPSVAPIDRGDMTAPAEETRPRDTTCTLAALNCDQFSTQGRVGRKLHELAFAAEQAGRHAEAICLAQPNVASNDGWLAGAANYDTSRAWEGLGCHELAIAAIETSLRVRPRDKSGWSETCDQCRRIGGTCAPCEASGGPDTGSPVTVQAVDDLVAAQAAALGHDAAAFADSFDEAAIGFLPHTVRLYQGRAEIADGAKTAWPAHDISSVTVGTGAVGTNVGVGWVATTWTIKSPAGSQVVRVTEVVRTTPRGLRVVAASFSRAPPNGSAGIDDDVGDGAWVSGDHVVDDWLFQPAELAHHVRRGGSTSLIGSDPAEFFVGGDRVQQTLTSWRNVKLTPVGPEKVMDLRNGNVVFARVLFAYVRWESSTPTTFRVLATFTPTGPEGMYELVAAHYSVVPRP